MNKQQIQDFYDEFHVPKHVIAHMETVWKVAKKILQEFEKKGFDLDHEIVKTAALLHDALRVSDFKDLNPKHFNQKVTATDMMKWMELRDKYGKIGHAKAISKILSERGHKKLGLLIEKHDFKRIDDLKTWEEKILYYADKRAEGDRITKLKERLEKGHNRNNDNEFDPSAPIVQKNLQLEKEIEEQIGQLPV